MASLRKLFFPEIKLEEVGPLELRHSTGDRKLGHFSAASGIQIVGDKLYAVADDELHLASFFLHSPHDGELLQALSGDLALDTRQRKKSKPDWEALACLPKVLMPPFGGLLLIPSGSRANRQQAVLWPLGESAPTGKAMMVDMTEIYGEISKSIKELNIEGAIATESQLKLYHRGNGGLKENAIVFLDMDKFIRFTSNHNSINPGEIIESIRFYDLEIPGHPVPTFSDAAPLSSGRTLFIASCEDTSSTFEDGEVLGSFLGLMDEREEIKWMAPFSIKIKAEGISIRETETQAEIFIATDPDDPLKPSMLYKYVLSKQELAHD